MSLPFFQTSATDEFVLVVNSAAGGNRTWLFNSRGIARKVKNPTCLTNYEIKDLGIEAHRECPNCKHLIDNSDDSLEWPGFPAGVKFDPTDAELLQHLAGKSGAENSRVHLFIDEFIPTLQGDQGICYTHPENLPGIKKDGNSVHFFHRISNAYSTGHRKRRKIHNERYSLSEERVRWHKTGKTKPVMDNGIQKGWKKIMVLYRSLKKGGKPDKVNWVMHQYHLGVDEEEKDGDLVVSKIFYQQNGKQIEKNEVENEAVVEDSNVATVGTCPRTPMIAVTHPPRPQKNSPLSEAQDCNPQKEVIPEVKEPELAAYQMNQGLNSLWSSGDSQAIGEQDPNSLEDLLFCHEVLDPSSGLGNRSNNGLPDGNNMMFPELDSLDMGTPLDFQLSDLQFGSQDSISSWLDRF